MHVVYPVVVSALLFSIGVYGVLARGYRRECDPDC